MAGALGMVVRALAAGAPGRPPRMPSAGVSIRLPVAGFAAVLALGLAGCGGGEGLDGAFGAQDTGVATPTVSGSSAGIINSANTGALTVGTGPDALNYDCPVLTVRSGASSWQVTQGGGLRYQGTIGRLARECSIVNGQMLVKVGIEGRVLLGEKGTPGQVKVPIRIAVVNEGPNPKTVTTKFFAVAVDVPADPGHAAFTTVEDQIVFPLLKPGEMERYVIYVGFDPQGTETRERPARPAPSASRPRPAPAATSAAPAAPSSGASAPAASTSKPASSSSSNGSVPDVFGPPPSGGGLSSSPSSGGFEAPPSTSTFSAPPR